MSTTIPDDTQHGSVWLLLPWLANGRLSEADMRRVAAHLVSCAACREELAIQRQIQAVIAADVPVDQIPTASLKKLHERLDGVAARREDGAAPGPGVQRMAAAPRLGVAIAASLAVAAAAALMLGTPALRAHRSAGLTPGEYRTVTSAPAPQKGAVIRAVFQSTLTLAQLQSVLRDAGLRIVDGPTDAGVYSLAMDGSESVEWSLQYLRANEVVRFAEPLDATGQ